MGANETLLRWQIAAVILVQTFFAASFVQAGDRPLHQSIDHHVEAGFSRWKISAAGNCSDAEFVRRVTLDLTGTIPTAETAQKFLESADPEKRVKLVDHLLASEEYARHMALNFDVMLMERRPDKHIPTNDWRGYLIESFAKNKSLNTLVREILGSDGVEERLRPAAKFFLDREVEKDTLVRDIGRLFLGVDLQCAQCHDHPGIGDYLHRHYHGLSVFVAGSTAFRQADGKIVLQELVMREVEYASVFDPDHTQKTGPQLLETAIDLPEQIEGEEYVEKPSKKVRAVPKFSLRKLLAEKLPNEETPQFARNMANRIWALMMGRGLVHPLDMHHSDNPPSHPELLDLLAKRFVQSNYDVKWLLRELALSKTYQRSSLLPEGIDPDAVPMESFAVANMKGLSPEQLFQSLLRATKSEKLLDQRIEEELKAGETAYQILAADQEKLALARAEAKTEWVSEFVKWFGSSPGHPEEGFQASLPQALFLANSETVIAWIEPGAGNLTETLSQRNNPAKIAEDAYLNILSRNPTPEESKLIEDYLTSRTTDRPAAVKDLVWSLVASSEFRLNH